MLSAHSSGMWCSQFSTYHAEAKSSMLQVAFCSSMPLLRSTTTSNLCWDGHRCPQIVCKRMANCCLIFLVFIDVHVRCQRTTIDTTFNKIPTRTKIMVFTLNTVCFLCARAAQRVSSVSQARARAHRYTQTFIYSISFCYFDRTDQQQ